MNKFVWHPDTVTGSSINLSKFALKPSKYPKNNNPQHNNINSGSQKNHPSNTKNNNKHERQQTKTPLEKTKSQRNPHLNAHKIRINMINKVFNLLSLITFGKRDVRIFNTMAIWRLWWQLRQSDITTSIQLVKLKLTFVCDIPSHSAREREISIVWAPNNLFTIPIWVSCVVTLFQIHSIAWGSFWCY